MADENEMLTIEMAPSDRMRLNNQIVVQMEKLGYTAYNWEELKLGFEPPPGWPIDKDAQPTLAQLVVFARKLKMKIIIGDLNLVPCKEF